MLRAQQGHAVFATGHQQCAQLQLRHQGGALGHQFGLITAVADDGFELVQVRRDQACTTVDGEVFTFGIGQHGNAFATRQLHQCLMVLQRAFAVVRENQHFDAVQLRFHARSQGGAVGAERLFEVHAQQLLMTAHHAQFDDSRLVFDRLEEGLYANRL